ncbi:MAG: hypothetical protein ACK4YQ_01440 [Phenylobacterium sp.]|uniref:hypothetical protein n=1 Tax=Phenylobacterium sp. TaxID=1871053 RepID=UPI003919664B
MAARLLLPALSILVALGACAPEPKPALPPMSLVLGDPVPLDGATGFPVRIVNDSDRTSPPINLACRFRNAEGVLIFSDGRKVPALAPGAADDWTIRAPEDLAADVERLTCAVLDD